MGFLSRLSLLALAVSAVVAAPTALTTPNPHVRQNIPCKLLGRCCLSDSQAQNIVDTFKYLLANPKASDFNSTANALLADDFSEYSDSVNFIIHIPVSFTIRSS